MEQEKMVELYNEIGETASLREVCEWWIQKYNSNSFILNPESIVEIRKHAKKLLLYLK